MCRVCGVCRMMSGWLMCVWGVWSMSYDVGVVDVLCVGCMECVVDRDGYI